MGDFKGLGGGGGGAAGAVWSRYGVAATAAVTMIYLVGRLLSSTSLTSSTSGSSPNSRKPHPGAFWLTVELTFKRMDDVGEFERHFKPLAEYVRRHEPGTLTYQMAKSEKEPLKVVIYERYASKADYIDVHKSSKPFLEFRPKLTALDPEIKGHGWLESDFGFV